MNKEDIISSGLLELYALGLASQEENAQVEAWINQYPEIKQEIEEIEISLESYAQAHAIKPSPTLKNKILSQIGQDESNKIQNLSSAKSGSHTNVYRIPSFFKLAAAAMILLLIGSMIFNYSYYKRYQSANNDLLVVQQKINQLNAANVAMNQKYQSASNDLRLLQQKINQQEAANLAINKKYQSADVNLQLTQEKFNQQEAANLAMNKDIDVMTDKNSLPVVLKGTPHAPDALAKIFWMKNTGEVYVDPSNLPAVPQGKQYQLWAIVNGKPISGGMISTKKGIYHIQKMKSFGHAEAFAITMEKAGGSPTPTMDQMYVIAKI